MRTYAAIVSISRINPDKRTVETRKDLAPKQEYELPACRRCLHYTEASKHERPMNSLSPINSTNRFDRKAIVPRQEAKSHRSITLIAFPSV